MIKQIRSFQAGIISSVKKMSNVRGVGRGSSSLRGLEEEMALELRHEWEERQPCEDSRRASSGRRDTHKSWGRNEVGLCREQKATVAFCKTKHPDKSDDQEELYYPGAGGPIDLDFILNMSGTCWKVLSWVVTRSDIGFAKITLDAGRSTA